MYQNCLITVFLLNFGMWRVKFHIPVSYTHLNKNSWDPGTLPTRMLNETLTFDQPGEYAYYRMRLKMEGAAYWAFFEMNFYNQDKLIDLLPSKFFNSAWMSATTGEEWVYVDLGSQSEFDKVKLHWINKAIKGKIQVSDDAKQWVDIANLPGGDANLDEIKLKGKGRYVRVWMEQPANDGRYILSEIEVMGKGGLLAQPAAAPAATKDEIRLSGGNWKVQRASEVTASGEEISKPSFSPENWIVATVPGTVLSSYKNIGAIPNPNYADNLMPVSYTHLDVYKRQLPPLRRYLPPKDSSSTYLNPPETRHPR